MSYFEHFKVHSLSEKYQGEYSAEPKKGCKRKRQSAESDMRLDDFHDSNYWKLTDGPRVRKRKNERNFSSPSKTVNTKNQTRRRKNQGEEREKEKQRKAIQQQKN